MEFSYLYRFIFESLIVGLGAGFFVFFGLMLLKNLRRKRWRYITEKPME